LLINFGQEILQTNIFYKTVIKRIMIILTMGVLMHTHSYSQQWLDLDHGFSCPTWNNNQVSDLLILGDTIYARGDINATYYCDEI
jgi:hypothetical protein